MKYLIIPVIALLSGCALFSEEITESADAVADGVDRYCDEVSQASREKFRSKVNPTPGGASIVVTCPGD